MYEIKSAEIDFKNHRQITVNGEEYFHVEKVEVFTVDDNGKFIDSKVIDSPPYHTGPGLRVVDGAPTKSKYRLRGEPAVRIQLDAECTSQKVIIEISHHKGLIFLDVRTIPETLVNMI